MPLTVRSPFFERPANRRRAGTTRGPKEGASGFSLNYWKKSIGRHTLLGPTALRSPRSSTEGLQLIDQRSSEIKITRPAGRKRGATPGCVVRSRATIVRHHTSLFPTASLSPIVKRPGRRLPMARSLSWESTQKKSERKADLSFLSFRVGGGGVLGDRKLPTPLNARPAQPLTKMAPSRRLTVCNANVQMCQCVNVRMCACAAAYAYVRPPF